MSDNSKVRPAIQKLTQKFNGMTQKDPGLLDYMPDKAVSERALQEQLSIREKIELICDAYADRTALSERTYTIEPRRDGEGSHRKYQIEFSGISYREFLNRVHGLASAWRCSKAHSVKPDDMVCIIGFASIDFQIIDTACLFAQTITVPMQSMTSGADLNEIIENINPATIAASVSDLKEAVEQAISHGGVRSLIVFDYEPRDDCDHKLYREAEELIAASGLSINLISLQDLIETGRTINWEPLPPHPKGEERLAAVIHSSGSTGKPKGAMLLEKAVRQLWDIILSAPRSTPQLTVCYAPLNHLLGRSNVTGALAVGGTCSFTLKPDMSTLFEDVRITEPTSLNFFPRVFELIYQNYQNEVAKRVHEGEDESTAAISVKADMGENFLGGRLLSGMVGGAPTSPAVREFMAECFDFLLLDGYGNTESGTGSVAMNGRIQSSTVSEYKLRDVPELGYYTSDKPYPRGELCYKGKAAITGYYNDPEATAGLFDEEGFSLTGDIVEEREPGHIVVIDRRKDVLKLSQGEYVALGNLQTKFESGTAAIKQIYLYGNSLQSYLLAVIVPDFDAVRSLIGHDANDAELDALLRGEMQRIAREKDIKSFEVPRDFIIERVAFSQENGLLSSVRKRLAPALKKKYGERLEAIYDEHANRKDAKLKLLKDPSSGLTSEEKICEVLKYTLNNENISPDSQGNFADLGGDSLGAVAFSLSLEEIFGVSIPADILLSPTASISRWTDLIEKALNGETEGVTFEDIHGKDTKEIFASDLKISRFLTKEELEKANESTAVAKDEKVVLLTGANGFLGRFVCMELLQKAAAAGGKVICLIRAHDNARARDRLDTVFATDATLESDYRRLAEDHLEVLAGDFGDSNLGLDKTTYSRLTAEVDRIIHVGALVNHMMSYRNHFAANVVGMAEIIKLALLESKKPVDFVSSVSAGYYLDTSRGLNEDSPLNDSASLEEFYAAGYGLSKWAGEQLLTDAHRTYGLPVNVFRGDMMLAHNGYAAQINADDMFTRLLFSVIETGLAPRSFYQLGHGGEIQKGHYNGLPVDVVAQAIVGGREFNGDSYKVFYVSNYHYDDGCSLDSFVNWIETAGYPITRIENHSEWCDRFEQKLKALPEDRRLKSSLALMDALRYPYPVEGAGPDCENFQSLMADCLKVDVPNLDQAFIDKCLSDMRIKNILSS